MYKPQKSFLVALVLVAVGLKLLPYLLNIWSFQGYPWGMTLAFSVGIFGVALFQDLRLAFGLPLLIWFLSDLGIGLVSALQFGSSEGFRYALYPGQVFNYLSLIAASACGLLVRRWRNWGTILAASVIGPTFFYLVSNPATWYFDVSIGYSRDFSGLMQAYVAGLPFYKNSLLSTLGFSVILFSPLGIAQLRWQDSAGSVTPEAAQGTTLDSL